MKIVVTAVSDVKTCQQTDFGIEPKTTAPNSSRDTWDLIEQSIEYAVDTNLSLIITGDFNDNQLRNSSTKMRDILKTTTSSNLLTNLLPLQNILLLWLTFL